MFVYSNISGIMSEMSGLLSSASLEDPENRPQSEASTNEVTSDKAQDGSASPSDPASSLRAAALLTLKSKRRKPITDQGLPRPIPSGLILNYGEEEYPVTTAPSSVENTLTSPAKAAPSEVEDNREEGEISDTESTPPAAPKHKAIPKKSMKAKATSVDKKSGKTSAKKSLMSSKPPLHAKVHAASQKQDIALPTPVDGSSLGPHIQYGIPQVPRYVSQHVVDADHVRPGLASSFHFFRDPGRVLLADCCAFSECTTL